jgi:hypothetical protein
MIILPFQFPGKFARSVSSAIAIRVNGPIWTLSAFQRMMKAAPNGSIPNFTFLQEAPIVPAFDAERPEYVAVVCPVCRTRIEARVREQPGSVECPDCFTQVDVPALEAVLSSRPVPVELPDPGTYAIAAEPDRPRRPEPPEPAVVSLACPGCGTSVNADLGERPRNITCPECLDVIPVPAISDARRKLKRREGPANRTLGASGSLSQNQDVDDIPPEDLDREPPPVDLLAAEGEIRREPPPPIPTWTFFTRVFSLPWHPEVLSRWVYTSLGWCVLGLIVASVRWLLLNGFIIAIPFFALPIVLLVLWTGSFLVSSTVTIVEDTAAGNDVIQHFNDGGVGDWLADSIGPVFLAAVAWMASFAIARITAVAAGGDWYWPVFGGTFFLLFPVVLLSALLAGSYWTPLALPVLKTLVRKPWAWGLFYVLTALVVAAYAVPLLYGLGGGRWFLTLFLTGPLFSTAMFIAARLLGRLGWKTLLADAKPAAGGPLAADEARRPRSRKRNSPPSP